MEARLTNPFSSAAAAWRGTNPVVREIVLLIAALLIGITLMPIGVYFVGERVLGAYGTDQGLGSFWGDFFRGLGRGAMAQWLLFVGPYALLQFLRGTARALG